jgi:hypothetical protein
MEFTNFSVILYLPSVRLEYVLALCQNQIQTDDPGGHEIFQIHSPQNPLPFFLHPAIFPDHRRFKTHPAALPNHPWSWELAVPHGPRPSPKRHLQYGPKTPTPAREWHNAVCFEPLQRNPVIVKLVLSSLG